MSFFAKKYRALSKEQSKYWFDKRQIATVAELNPYLVLYRGNRCGVYNSTPTLQDVPFATLQVTCSILNPDAGSSVSDVKMTAPFCRLQTAKSGLEPEFQRKLYFCQTQSV